MSESVDERPDELIARWRAGDQGAAAELFSRYSGRLIGFVQSRLSSKLARRFDPEDVVQSAYRSFFLGTRDGRYVAERGADLWQLLVAIALHKLQRQVKRNRQQKRSVERERQSANGPHGIPVEVLSQEPSPVEAAALADEVEQLMRGLEPRDRRVLELRLQGHNLEEIATAADAGLRTVCRVLERIKGRLEQWRPGDGA